MAPAELAGAGSLPCPTPPPCLKSPLGASRGWPPLALRCARLAGGTWGQAPGTAGCPVSWPGALATFSARQLL